jgi:hypothetical protein
MGLKRELASAYILVFGGLATGLLIGLFVIEYDPQIVGVLFCTGGGIAIGAFIAAITSGIPLAGNPGTGTRYSRVDDLDEDDWRDPRDR